MKRNKVTDLTYLSIKDDITSIFDGSNGGRGAMSGHHDEDRLDELDNVRLRREDNDQPPRIIHVDQHLLVCKVHHIHHQAGPHINTTLSENNIIS